MGLLMAGRNCSLGNETPGRRTGLGLGKVCLEHTSFWQRSAADLIDRRIPVTDLISQSPGHEQALALRVFHFNRHAIASGVFDLKHHSIDQALAAKVFNLDNRTIQRVPALKVVHLDRDNLAPRIFHLNHHVIGQSRTRKGFFSELR
jgi:hypothetical protein